MRHIITLSLLFPLTLASCGGQKEKELASAITELAAETTEPTVEFIAKRPSRDERFLIIVPFIDPENVETRADYLEFWDSMEDTIASGMLAYSHNYEVALLHELKLGEKWLCVMFPDSMERKKLEIDTLTTVGYMTNDFPQDYQITTLSVTPERNKKNNRALTESDPKDWVLNYNIAFRGNYSPSDFKYYDKKAISLKDSLRITDIIRKGLHREYMTKPSGLTTDSLYLLKMAHLNDDLYYAEYKSKYIEDDIYSQGSSIFLVKGEQILLWNKGSFTLQVEVFKLKNQEYIWVEEFMYAQSLTGMYTLSGSTIAPLYHTMFTGD